MKTDPQLIDILKGCESGFRPYHELNRDADALTVYFKGDADYSKRLTEHVTLYLSIDTDEIVGCRIKGITGILEDLPNYIHINHGQVQVSMIFWSFRGGLTEDARIALNTLARAAAENEMELDRSLESGT